MCSGKVWAVMRRRCSLFPVFPLEKHWRKWSPPLLYLVMVFVGYCPESFQCWFRLSLPVRLDLHSWLPPHRLQWRNFILFSLFLIFALLFFVLLLDQERFILRTWMISIPHFVKDRLYFFKGVVILDDLAFKLSLSIYPFLLYLEEFILVFISNCESLGQEWWLVEDSWSPLHLREELVDRTLDLGFFLVKKWVLSIHLFSFRCHSSSCFSALLPFSFMSL